MCQLDLPWWKLVDRLGANMHYRPHPIPYHDDYDRYYHTTYYRPYNDLLLYELMRDRDYYRNKYLDEVYKVDPCDYSDLLCRYKR